MKNTLIILFSLILMSCTPSYDKEETERNETLENFERRKEELEKDIQLLKEKAQNEAGNAQRDIETTLKKLERQKEKLINEADKLRKATRKELDNALKDAKKEYEKWVKEKKKQMDN